MKCPICGGTDFASRAGRENARCRTCGAMERTRLLYLILKKLDILKPNIRILHIAPELGLIKVFSNLSPIGYYPCDISPADYENPYCQISRIDLCQDLRIFPTQIFDLIIHNHVLEHIPCSVEQTLRELTRILKPDGYHLFTVPIEAGSTDEDLSDLGQDERTNRFGQFDHMRKFGTADFIPLLQTLWQVESVFIKNNEWLSFPEYLEAALPKQHFSQISGSTIFCQSSKLGFQAHVLG
jgi:SAM-dependent methyltransferase